MARQYRTSSNDSLDRIVWKVYGRQSNRIVETVLQANPGLASHGPLLPAGLLIELPQVSNATGQQQVRLWG
ncbi:phage tail protein X [Kushneria sinocarnis]|uniref:Phage tail protein X n=1 Tax=Kushneria sinocarnis TaxID=595502 RepID=A0A420WVJ2_9GAMM|nr:tail protein X [Kushneria sinocarnis]RKR02580.1 phage tail protein X [Kushneria sinocarnis]